MASKIVEIANAVVTALNTAPALTFSQTFAAIRLYIPVFTLPDLETIAVVVVPKSHVRDRQSKTRVAQTIDIDIGVAKKIATTSDGADAAKLTEIDALLAFVEELSAYFEASATRTSALASTGASLLHAAHDPIYDQEKLRTERTFVSLCTLTFVVL